MQQLFRIANVSAKQEGGLSKLLEKVQLRNLHFKKCFPVSFLFFLEVEKGRFPYRSTSKKLTTWVWARDRTRKKSSLQNAQTSTRIHHKPFPAFSSHIIFLQSENNTLKTPLLLYLNWYSHSFQKTYFHSPRASSPRTVPFLISHIFSLSHLFILLSLSLTASDLMMASYLLIFLSMQLGRILPCLEYKTSWSTT